MMITLGGIGVSLGIGTSMSKRGYMLSLGPVLKSRVLDRGCL
jgi:hypothetical protein